MNAYHSDPQLALTTLEKIAEEIPSGVSAPEVGQIVSNMGPCPMEITEQLQASIVNQLKSNLNEFWDLQEVNQKLEQAKNCNAIKKDKGLCLLQQDLMNIITAKHLRSLKDALVVKIQKVEEENQSLETCLKSKVQLINKQNSVVKSQDFVF